MVRLLVAALIQLAAAAVGILAANALLDDVTLHTNGFITVVLIYTVIQMIIGPFIFKVAAKNARAFLGGIGLVSTFVALLAATFVGNALEISGVSTWIAATVIVWLVTALATLVLPLVLVKAGVQSASRRREA
jgi:hypothetical protein